MNGVNLSQVFWKRVFIVIFTSITILSSAASCSFLGINFGGSNVSLGMIKRDPGIKENGFGFINQEKLYTGEVKENGISGSSGLKVLQAGNGVLYFLTAQNGFFKTTDGGKNWERKYIFGFEGTATEKKAVQKEIDSWLKKNNSLKVTDFSVASNNNNIVYVAGQYDNVGRIYKTDTGGDDFKQIYTSVEAKGFVRFVVVDPQNNSNIYALVGTDTIIRSTNGGETWQKIQVFTNQTVVQLGFYANTSTSLFALLKTGGVSLSRDNGNTWTTSVLGRGESVLKEAETDGGLFNEKSKDANKFSDYEKLISISDGQSWLLIADQQIWFSRSLQNVFQKILLPTEAIKYETYDIVTYPGQGSKKMLVGVNNKLFETKDGGVTWSTDDKIGLQTPIGNIGQILIDENNPEIIYIMLVDSKTVRKDGLYQSTGGGGLLG